jgi:hypothetical protein
MHTKYLSEKYEGKRLLGRSRHRWEDNYKMDLKGKGLVSLGWIHLAKNRVQWRALLNTVMKLRVHKRRGISLLAELLSASQEGLCSIELVNFTAC